MYQVDKDTELTATLIKDAIDFNEKRRKRFNKLDDYYLGRQDIMNRVKNQTLINNKVMVNHAKYIVDVSVGYLLGNPVDYQPVEGLDIQPVLDAYKKQTIENIDVEIAKDVAIFGMKYEYIYANENAEPCSVDLDVRNTIIVYDDTMVHNKMYGINYRPIFKDPEDPVPDHYDVIACTDKEIIKFILKGVELKEMSRENHAFSKVPIIEYRNNSELMGDFEPVLSLIDAYNLVQSDRVNDREQLVDAILCFYGMHFDLEQMDELKLRRALSNIPADGKVEYLTKQVSESDVDILRQNLEKDIHKISMVPNMSDENFVGNSSGVALRYKLLTFEQAIKNKERFFEKGLLERFEMYANFLAVKSEMKQINIEDIDAVFKRNLPSNDLELSQMINNLTGLVDKELLVAQLSFVKDASETVQIAEQEQKRLEEEYAANDFGDKNKEKDDPETNE